MPAARSPTVRRRELGTMLRTLRNSRGWTVEHVAEQLLCSPSKVSRLETGHRGVSARDIRDLCDLYQVTGDERQLLIDLAAEGKQQAWWQSRGLPYSTYVGLESAATEIRDFALSLVPGLLQTPDYARAAAEANVPHKLSPELIEQLVEGRMARQQILIGPSPPALDAVLDMSVLHRLVGGPSVMRQQLRRLLEAADLPNVTIRIVSYEAGALPSANNKFIILSFGSASLSDLVFIEGLTGDLYLDREEDARVYHDAYRALQGIAATPQESRDIIVSRSLAWGL